RGGDPRPARDPPRLRAARALVAAAGLPADAGPRSRVRFPAIPAHTGMMERVLWVVAAYLAGSIPFGVLFARARGVDLRQVGSGNIGATNASRALGKKIGALVFLCDAAKGTAPVLLARWRLGESGQASWWVAGVGAAAFVGHLASPWLRFRGGKGVATAFGVFV